MGHFERREGDEYYDGRFWWADYAEYRQELAEHREDD